MDIALDYKRNNQNSVSKGGNKYNRVNIGNNADINGGVDIDKNSGTSNIFRNNTYKLVFKGIKLQNQKYTINILYYWNYKQLMAAVKLF